MRNNFKSSDFLNADEEKSQEVPAMKSSDFINDAPKDHPSMMSRAAHKAGELASGLAMLPIRTVMGGIGVAKEAVSDPEKSIKDMYQSARGEFQNRLLPALEQAAKFSAKTNPLFHAAPETLSKIQGGKSELPKYKQDDPESYSAGAGSLIAQMLPGEKAASLSSGLTKKLMSKLPGFAGKKYIAPIAEKAVGGASSAPIYDIDPTSGAALNVFAHGAKNAAKLSGRYAKNIASKALLPDALAKNLEGHYKDASILSNHDDAHKALSEYKGRVGEYVRDPETGEKVIDLETGKQKYIPGTENIAWDSARKSGAGLDGQRSRLFDKSSFKNDLEEARKEVVKNYGSEEKSVNRAQGIIDEELAKIKRVSGVAKTTAPLESIVDAIQQKQANNAKYRALKTNSADIPLDHKAAISAHNAIRDAYTNSLKSTIKKNQDLPGINDFAKEYTDANKITQYIKNNFESMSTPSGGGTKPTNFINNLKNTHESSTLGLIHKEFLPKSGQGVVRMEQFSKMLGSKEAAKKSIIRNMFAPAMETEEINPKKAANAYNKLDPDQKKWLFTDRQREEFKLLNLTNRFKNKGTTTKFGSIPVGIISLLHDGIQGIEGTDLGDSVGQRMLNAELSKRLGAQKKRGLMPELTRQAGKYGSQLGKAGLMTSAQPDQQLLGAQ